MVEVPIECPYCGVDVTHVHSKKRTILPDERARMPPQRRGAVEGEAIPLRLFSPCGHAFRTVDVQKWRNGELSTRMLGDRVQNPHPDSDG